MRPPSAFRLFAAALLWFAMAWPTLLCGQMAVTVSGRPFERSPAETGARGEWVFYEKGAPRDEGSRRWLTKRVLVNLPPAAAVPGVLAELRALPGVARVTARGDYAVVEFAGAPDAAVLGAARILQVPGVRSAEPMLARQWSRSWVPDDPLFPYDAARPGYQWHLRNTGENGATTGIDLNVVPAWDTYRGSGVHIGIVDDGLALRHPDLQANADAALSYDFNDGDSDPAPGEDDFHGTACAGVAAARGNNGIGVSGTAPEASLAGLRLVSAPSTDAEEADAIAFRQDAIEIKSNSWGPFDSAYGASGPGPLSRAAIESAVANGRGGKGTIFLWAAGNGNGAGDDSNYNGWANLTEVIAVSAVNDKGRPAWFSEPGANILVCAPSNGGVQGITTTDLEDAGGYNEDGGLVEYPDYADTGYTNTFGGTSSATPAVAGVVALMLQANPNLTWRDVQEILVRTAVQNDQFHGGWITNAGGFHFNPRYGAGLVNAAAATALAATWTTVAPLVSHAYAQTNLAANIPDADDAGISRVFTVPNAENLRLEHVRVHVKATHPYVGNLEWRLTSPSGISSTLAQARFNDNSANLDWTFSSTHFWGENSVGDWKLEVIDRMVDSAGTLDEVTITFQGTTVAAGQSFPVITSDWLIVGREDWNLEHQITASGSPTSFDAGRLYLPGLPAGLSVNQASGLLSGTPSETGLFESYQSATNTAGTSSTFAYIYILAGTPSLPPAVDQPASLKIIPFGYGDPFTQTAVTHDGEDAIETAPVKNEEYSGIEFTVTGPARLEFQWKVSSEKNYDYLVLTVDGVVEDYITGEVDWTVSTTYLGDGPHNVDIYYLKDRGESKGQDKGWIDQVVITPVAAAPALVTQSVQAYDNVYFRLPLEATNAPDEFAVEGLPPGVFLHAPSGLLYGTAQGTGTFPLTVHATNSSGTGTATVMLEVGSVVTGLADAIDAPAQVMTTTEPVGWARQTTYSSDGRDSARSGAIGDLAETSMSAEVSGPCKVVFYWAVSSETGFDFLHFLVDDVSQASVSGDTGWVRKAFVLGPGPHTLTWSYRKDNFTKAGLDAGFVDRFAIYQDGDEDGMHGDLEAWFGTSDSDAAIRPSPAISRSGGNTHLQFSSVAGNDYRIEYSEDLRIWEAFPGLVTATGPLTTWIDRNTANKPRRFYRVVMP